MTEILIGAHCSISTCNQLDFLPFTCSYCNKVYCRFHKDITSHQCMKYEQVSNQDKISFEIVRYKCSFGDCKKTEAVSVRCSMCGEQFCVAHRTAELHTCPQLVKQVNPALKINPTTTPTYKVPKKIKYKSKKQEKLAAKVALMKLKQSAVGGKSVPSNKKLYLLVHTPHNGNNLPICLSHDWTVGRALDHLADASNLKNTNHVTGDGRLGIFSASDGSLLPMSEVLNDLIGREIIYNGSTVVLARHNDETSN